MIKNIDDLYHYMAELPKALLQEIASTGDKMASCVQAKDILAHEICADFAKAEYDRCGLGESDDVEYLRLFVIFMNAETVLEELDNDKGQN